MLLALLLLLMPSVLLQRLLPLPSFFVAAGDCAIAAATDYVRALANFATTAVVFSPTIATDPFYCTSLCYCCCYGYILLVQHSKALILHSIVHCVSPDSVATLLHFLQA